MVATLVLGSCVYVQGLIIARNPSGTVTIQLGDDFFTGKPIESRRNQT